LPRPAAWRFRARPVTKAGKRLSVALADAGPYRFKNIEEPIQVWSWQPAGSDARRPCAQTSNETSVTNLPAQYRTAIVGVLPFANLSESAGRVFFRRADRGPDPRAFTAIVLPGAEPQLDVLVQGQNVSTRLIAREIDASYLIQGSVRRAANKIRVTAELIAPETGEQLWTGRFDRDIGDLFAMQDELTTSLSAAIAAEIYRAEASAPPRSSSNDLTAWDRFLKGLSYYYLQTQADLETSISCSRKPSRSIRRCRSRAPISPPSRSRAIQFGWIKEHARSVGSRNEPRGEQRPARSPFVLCVQILAYLHAAEGHYEAAMDAAKRAVGLNPYDMGARGVLGICHLVSGEHRHADRTVYDGGAERQQRSPVSMGGRERVRPLPARAVRCFAVLGARAALYQSQYASGTRDPRGGARPIGTNFGGGNGGRGSAQQLPSLTVERHLRNFHWKMPEDIAHYATAF
jgi:adenylate cyclase